MAAALPFVTAGSALAGGAAQLAAPKAPAPQVAPNGANPPLSPGQGVAQSLSGLGGVSPGTPSVTVPQMQNLTTLLAAFGKQGN